MPLWLIRADCGACSTKMPPLRSHKRRRVACQHFPDNQTLRLQAGAGEDNVIHLPSGLDRVDCERQEEEEISDWFQVTNSKAASIQTMLISKQTLCSRWLCFGTHYYHVALFHMSVQAEDDCGTETVHSHVSWTVMDTGQLRSWDTVIYMGHSHAHGSLSCALDNVMNTGHS